MQNLPAAIAETRLDILGAIGDTLIARGDGQLVSGSQTGMRPIDLHLFLIYYLDYLQYRDGRPKRRDRIMHAIATSKDVTASERAELEGLSGKKRRRLHEMAMRSMTIAILATYTIAGPYVLDNQQIVTTALDALDQRPRTSTRGGRRLRDAQRTQFLKQIEKVPIEVLSILAEHSALAHLSKRGYPIDPVPDNIPQIAKDIKESQAGQALRSICRPWPPPMA